MDTSETVDDRLCRFAAPPYLGAGPLAVQVQTPLRTLPFISDIKPTKSDYNWQFSNIRQRRRTRSSLRLDRVHDLSIGIAVVTVRSPLLNQ